MFEVLFASWKPHGKIRLRAMIACCPVDEMRLLLMAQLPKHARMSFESHLQEVLNGVAVLNKTGPNRDKWQVLC